MKRFAIFLILLISLAGLSCFTCIPGCSGVRSTTPQEVMNDFEQQRQQFVELRSMLDEDVNIPLHAISTKRVNSFYNDGNGWHQGHPDSADYEVIITEAEMLEKVGLAPERFQEYLENLTELGASRLERIKRYIDQEHQSVIQFKMDSWGIFFSGGQLSVIWSENVPDPLVIEPSEKPSPGREYISLGDNWYLERETL